MGFVLLCVSIQVLLADDFEIKSGTENSSFAAVYNSVKCVDGNFTFGNGVFSEAYVKVDSPTIRLTLCGNDTEYKSTSSSSAFDITRTVAIRFTKIKFTFAANPHSQSYFRGTDGFDIFFDACVFTNIAACKDKNPLLISNDKGVVILGIYNSEIKDLRLGNFSNGGLMHLISDSLSTLSNAVFENVRIFNISGGNLTNTVIRFSGIGGGQVNFTKCTIGTIMDIGEYGFLYSSWDVHVGTSYFSGFKNMTSGCLYVSGINIMLTVVRSSFDDILFKKRGAVYFSGGLTGSHSYNGVNMTNIFNDAKDGCTAGVVSLSLTLTTFNQCFFANLKAKKSTTIDQQLTGGVDVRGCKFSNIEAISGRPAGIAAVFSTVAVGIYNCEFNLLTSKESSTVAFSYRPMIWHSVKVWNCTGGLNGATFCLWSDLVCDNCSFTDLDSKGDGGVLHFHVGTMSITRSKFENCHAKGYGGGLYAPPDNYFFSNCIFLNNSAKNTNGGNDIYFPTSLLKYKLTATKMYGCCSTSAPPRINNQKSGTIVDTFLPTCTLGVKYVGIKDGVNATGCGSSPFSPCRNLAYCGELYTVNNPLVIHLNGESFDESTSLVVAARSIEATGDSSGRTLLKRGVEDVVLIDVTTGSFEGNNLNFDATGSITVLKVRGVGQATLRDGSFTNTDNLSISKPVVFVDNAGAKVSFQSIVFHHIHVIDQSAIYLRCDAASFTSCDFFNLSSSYDPSKSSFGGALTFVNSNFLEVVGGSFKFCNTTGNGGAVSVSNGTFSFDSVVFEECRASAGGAIYISNLQLLSGKSGHLSFCNFLTNQASTYKHGNDIRDENGTSRWNGGNIVYCCSNGRSDNETFRFSVGPGSKLQSNDAHLPTCAISASICEALTEKELCEKNRSCVWDNDNDTCKPHKCATPPEGVCPPECKKVEGVCVVCTPAICETTSIVNCSDFNTTESCIDESCIWSGDTCLWNPCSAILSESFCVGRGCTWVAGTGTEKSEKSRCEWNKCVFMGSENILTSECHPGCKRDPTRICSVDICEGATEAECNKTDCDWVKDKCEWHECVRMHSEGVCYAGCVLETRAEGDFRCKVDQCGKNKNEEDCVSEDHCTWIGDGSASASGECIWNYCDGHCELPGCKKTTSGVCVPDICSTIKSSTDGCYVNCVMDGDKCKINDCAELESSFECYVGCFNSSSAEAVCKQPHVCTFIMDRCMLNPCQKYFASSGGSCPVGCEKDPATSQCVPDKCIKRYHPYLNCSYNGDEECSPENTTLFDEACVYHPPKAKSEVNNAKGFPWWIVLVGLLVVAAIVVAVVALLVYNWKKKKSDKPRMQIEDVADDELLQRKGDEMDDVSDASSNASDFSDASGYSGGVSDASGYSSNASGASDASGYSSNASGASDASGYTGSTASGNTGSGYSGSSACNTAYTGYSGSNASKSGYSGYSGSNASGSSASGSGYSGYSGSNASGSGYSGYSGSNASGSSASGSNASGSGYSSSRSYSNPTASGGSKSRRSKASKKKGHSSGSEAPSGSGYGSEAPIGSGYTSASGYTGSSSRKGTKSRGSKSSSRSKSSLRSSKSKRSSAGSKSRASAATASAATGTKTKISSASGSKARGGTKSRGSVGSGAEGSKTKRSSSSRHSSGSKTTRSTVSKKSNASRKSSASKRSSASRRSTVSKRSTASKK